MDVSSEKVHDGKRLKRLANRAEDSVNVKRVLADGAYDSRANFNFLAQHGIKPVLRIRKGSVPKSRGSQAKKEAVIEQQAFKPKAWSNIHRFGYRWGWNVSSPASSASSGSTLQQGSSSIWPRRWP